MTMIAGERQVAPTLEGIRADHRARYEFAARTLHPGSRVIDFACGVGYGAKILADAGHLVHAFDANDEALTYAQAHFSHPLVTYRKADGYEPGELGDFDAAICFETVEHIEDPRPLLLALRTSAPQLLVSVPNEDVIPFKEGNFAFHFRHYTRLEFHQLLTACGWCPVAWHGQEGPESPVEMDVAGRTLVAVCTRDELPKSVSSGKHVAILGLGPSLDQFVEIAKRHGGTSRIWDEVWAINALGDLFACDLIFHMDDVRIQEIRAAAAPDSNIAAMVQWLKRTKTPVMTSRAHPDYPALIEFPLEDVLNNLGHDYFNSTAAYAVAYAVHRGDIAKISCFGMDFTYPKAHDAEKGRGCVEFWLGQAHARGINIVLPKTSTLMDSCYGHAARLYGYDTLDVKFDIQPNGMVKLTFVPREKLPTAEEIEKAYDHSIHPNPLMSEPIR